MWSEGKYCDLLQVCKSNENLHKHHCFSTVQIHKTLLILFRKQKRLESKLKKEQLGLTLHIKFELKHTR